MNLNCTKDNKNVEEIFNIDSLLEKNSNNFEFKNAINEMDTLRLKIFKAFFSYIADSVFKSDIYLIDEETNEKIDDFTYSIKSNRPRLQNKMFLEGINKGFKIIELKNFFNTGYSGNDSTLDTNSIKKLLEPIEYRAHVSGSYFDLEVLKDAEYNISIKSENYYPFNFKIDPRKENFKKWTTKEKYNQPIEYIKGNRLDYIVKLSKKDPSKNVILKKY